MGYIVALRGWMLVAGVPGSAGKVGGMVSMLVVMAMIVLMMAMIAMLMLWGSARGPISVGSAVAVKTLLARGNPPAFLVALLHYRRALS